jgi:hypothetical protein
MDLKRLGPYDILALRSGRCCGRFRLRRGHDQINPLATLPPLRGVAMAARRKGEVAVATRGSRGEWQVAQARASHKRSREALTSSILAV